METKTILIILILYYLFFSKISEKFSSYNDCLSIVAGRMLFQKESLEKAITSAENQNKCLDQNDKNSILNKFNSWEDSNDCKRFLKDTKNITPDNTSAENWFKTCIVKLQK